ncbi:MAG: PepSY-like domain-containing protein [Planctomycetota bacterium]|nr:PepSY-like domain-containing protein [Planctomycetota bacterium]
MNKIRTAILLVILLVLVTAGVAWYVFGLHGGKPASDTMVVNQPARPGDDHVALANLPKPVIDAVKLAVPEGVLRDAQKEMEDDQEVFDVEGNVGKLGFDMKVTPAGEVFELNQQIALESLPAPVTEALKNAAPDANIRAIEKQNTKGRIIYEIKANDPQGKLTLEFAEDGKLLKRKGAAKPIQAPQPAPPA